MKMRNIMLTLSNDQNNNFYNFYAVFQINVAGVDEAI